MNLTSGTLLERGKYRIISTLGRGGFGITYLAEQVLARRKVCIKEFFPKDYYKRDEGSDSISILSAGQAATMSRFKEKFLKEAQTIAALDHANIIHILDVLEENNTAYYVMEYVEGGSLNDIVKQRGALDEVVALRYIRDVAMALGYIHEQKVNHLDIKPANIMVRAKDDKAILIDFGLSKHYDEGGEQTSSTPVGISHGYAPMEQYNVGGVNSFSPATDIYSLGATLYYLVTGQQPPVASIVGEDGIGNLPAHLSSGVVSAIEKSMNYWRKNRPQSIFEFMLLLGIHEAVKPESVDETVVKVDIDANVVDNEETIISNVSPIEDVQPKQGERPPHDEIWYTSTDGEVVKPNSAFFAPTKKFGAKIISNTYQDGKGIIKLDGSVTIIGERVFNDLERLKTVIIPDSVTTIENGAFSFSKNIVDVVIPDSVKTIDNNAFKNCESLQGVIIPTSVSEIGSYAFANCVNLRTIVIPNSVNTLGKCVFSGCKSLSYVGMNNRIALIGDYMFSECSQLRSVVLPSTVMSIGDGAFRGCHGLLNINLPSSVMSIGDLAFYDCINLRNITIPQNVSYIGNYAFSGCVSLPQDIVYKIKLISRGTVQ